MWEWAINLNRFFKKRSPSRGVLVLRTGGIRESVLADGTSLFETKYVFHKFGSHSPPCESFVARTLNTAENLALKVDPTTGQCADDVASHFQGGRTSKRGSPDA